MDVSVVGLGRLGLPLAVAMLDRGINVIGIDIDQDKVDAINCGRINSDEPRVEDILRKHSLQATVDLHKAIEDTEITIILVATPSLGDGRLSLKQVLPACRDVGRMLRGKAEYHTIIISSTVNPGDCQGPIRKEIEQASQKSIGEGIGLCYCPEFVALGQSVEGFQHPDFVLIGGYDSASSLSALRLYNDLCSSDVPLCRTNLGNAELAKIALNCYMTTKITFANQIANLCEHIPGTNVDTIMDVLGLDSRIDYKYLVGATPFGGPCFPRDTKALAGIAGYYGTSCELIECVDKLNHAEIERLYNIVKGCLRRDGSVGILGLTYKPGVSVLEGSPSINLIERLEEAGIPTVAYDPMISIGISTRTAQDCVDRSDVVIVMTPCSEFETIWLRDQQFVIDCWRILNRHQVEEMHAIYVPIGVGP